MKLPISARLLACCNYVNQGDRVADIGCDHGYLGIHLLTSGTARFVIASDVNEQPLQSALRSASPAGRIFGSTCPVRAGISAGRPWRRMGNSFIRLWRQCGSLDISSQRPSAISLRHCARAAAACSRPIMKGCWTACGPPWLAFPTARSMKS